MRNFTLVGLTGPTGAGKSTVCEFLNYWGCHIINADALAKEAFLKDSTCLPALCAAFGYDIIDEYGNVDRKRLAEIAFFSKEQTLILNGITHPWICLKTLQTVNEIRNEFDNPIVILDAPLLFESSMDICCDYTVSVLSPQNVRLKRIMERDNLTHNEALSRMSAQYGENWYKEKSDYTINGNTDIENTKTDTFNVLKKIKEGDCN